MGTLEKLLLAGIVFSGIVFVSYRYWRQAFLFSLYLVVLEGGFRKWILPDFQEFIYLLKDFVVFGIYLRVYTTKIHQKNNYKIPDLIYFFLFCFVVWCVPQVLNPSSPSLLLGIFGLKTYLFYIPLALLLPLVFQTKEEFFDFLFKYGLFSLPIGILGIVQFFSPLDSPLVVYVGDASIEEGSISVAGENVRITGTFSYISGYSVYLAFIFSISLGLLFASWTSRWRIRLLTIGIFFLSIVNSLMTGSRSVLIFWVLFFSLFILLGGTILKGRIFNALPRVLVVLAVTGLLVALVFPQVIESISSRIRGSETELTDRVFLVVTAPLETVLRAPAIGVGIGATHPAARSIIPEVPLFSWLPFILEGEPERIILEIGPLGFGLFLALKLLFGWYLFYNCRNLVRDPDLRLLGFIGFLYLVLNILNPVVFNATSGFYFWFVAGFTFLLPNLDATLQSGAPPDDALKPRRP